MPDANDMDLMRDFARCNSEAAFAELVQRHINLVYSVAMRFTGQTHDAEDVTQAVFILLAKKAASLRERTVLTGWLYETTRFTASKLLRMKTRRAHHEQEAFMESPLNESESDGIWRQLAPHLEDAMSRLSERDRVLLALRYYENKSGAEAAALLGIQEDAAHKRTVRAVEKLRTFFSRRGITLSAVVITSAIAAKSVQAAPAGLAATVKAASLMATGAGTFSLINFMTLSKLKLAFNLVVVAAATTAFVIQHQAQTKLHGENERFKQRIDQLETDNGSFSNRLLAAGDSKMLSDERFKELLRLRAAVGMLRQQTNVLGKLLASKANSEWSSQPSEEKVSPEEKQKLMAIAKMNDATETCLAFLTSAGNNSSQFPTNFDQVASLVGDTNLFQTLTNEFDLAYQGSFNQTQITNSSSVILIQERQAWPTVDGKWAKTYGFADGHVEVHSESNDNFDAFEQQHMLSPPGNQ